MFLFGSGGVKGGLIRLAQLVCRLLEINLILQYFDYFYTLLTFNV